MFTEKRLPYDKLLPEKQPAYVASWIYVFGVSTLAALAVIILLESSPEGPLPFEQVRAVFHQRCHRSLPLTRVVAPAPLGIGEERWTPAGSLAGKIALVSRGGCTFSEKSCSTGLSGSYQKST